MANIKVLGNVFAITSGVKLDDLKRIKRFRPEALELKDGDGDPVFAIGIGCRGGFQDECVVFDCATADGQGLACVTADLPKIPEGKDVRDFLADEVGGILAKLNKLEVTLPGVIAEINAEHEAARPAIEVL